MTAKAVIILGNKLRGDDVHPELKGRLDVGIKVFKEISADYLILSGGRSNRNVKYAECEIMRDYAIKNGVLPKKIIMEQNSLDTIGNAYFTRIIADKIRDLSEIYVISSCYHMKRVKFVFKKVYDDFYLLNFDHCFPYNIPRVQEKEEKSIDMAKNFFEYIADGDIDKIKKRLFTSHKLYSKRLEDSNY